MRGGGGSHVLPPLLAAGAALALPGVARAHATIQPSESKPAEQQLYTLTVPNERDVPTVRVELQVPAEVETVLVEDTPGWKTEVERKGDRIDVLRFSGGSIAPDFFGTFHLIARNPVEEGELVWRVRQTYAGGEVVVWGGPPDSDTPASRTTITESASGEGAVDTHGGGHDADEEAMETEPTETAAAPAAAGDGDDRDTPTLVLALAALALAAAALVLAVRRR